MNVGKVHNYNGIIGQIITDKETYTFTYNGVEEEVKNGDLVYFKIRDEDDDIVTDVMPYKNKNDLKTLLKEQNKK